MQYAIANLVFIGVTILANAIGMTRWLTGSSIKDVSDEYKTKSTPSPAAFAVWLFIYGFLIWFGVYNVLNENLYGDIPSVIIILITVFNILWVFLFIYRWLEFAHLTLLIQGLLLLVVYYRYRIFYSKDMDWQTAFIIYGWVSLYLAWMVVASCLSEIMIDYKDEDKQDPPKTLSNTYSQYAAVRTTAIKIALIGSLMLIWRNDYFFGFVILWSLIFLYLRNSKMSEDTKDTKTTLMISIGLVLVSAGVSVALFLNNITF